MATCIRTFIWVFITRYETSKKNPKKYSGPWNFGTEKNTVTSVKQIAKIAQETWGTGKIIIKNTKKFYEQENLQLNISKSKKILGWKPKYSIKESVKLTVNWYKNTHENKNKCRRRNNKTNI